MILQVPGRTIEFPRRPLLMGIVNINDDSFSGDGSLDPEKALAQAKQLISDGADIIDIGAESARTNRGPISVTEEISRLQSFLTHWPQLLEEAQTADETQLQKPLLSVNTWRPEVAEAVLSQRVDILNDMSALPTARNAETCAVHDVALLIMHSVGLPKESHTHQQWPDLMAEMTDFFREKIRLALNAGLIMEHLILDPGIDFAKQKDDNILLLKELAQLHKFERPLLLPISRKGLIDDVLDQPQAQERDPGTLALLAHGVRQGAQIFRIHNVRAAWEALKLLDALERPPQTTHQRILAQQK